MVCIGLVWVLFTFINIVMLKWSFKWYIFITMVPSDGLHHDLLRIKRFELILNHHWIDLLHKIILVMSTHPYFFHPYTWNWYHREILVLNGNELLYKTIHGEIYWQGWSNMRLRLWQYMHCEPPHGFYLNLMLERLILGNIETFYHYPTIVMHCIIKFLFYVFYCVFSFPL